MKRRPTPPPVVERAHQRRVPTGAPTAPHQPPSDRRIRVWSADRPEPPRQPTYTEILQRQIEIFVYRLRGANSPDLLQEAAEAMTYREEAQRATASMIPVKHPHFGDVLLIVPKPEQRGMFTRLFQRLLPRVTLARTEDYDREMRKRKGKV